LTHPSTHTADNYSRNEELVTKLEDRNKKLLKQTEIGLQLVVLLQCMLQAFIFTLLWRDAAIFFGSIRGTIFTGLVLLPTVLMSWKVTPKILSNFCFASAVAELDNSILHEMMEDLTNSGDYTAAGQMLEISSLTPLTLEELKDKGKVRDKVHSLNKLGEQRWRYRVVEENQTPREEAIKVLDQAMKYVQVHLESQISDKAKLDEVGAKQDGFEKTKLTVDCCEPALRKSWALELSETLQGLAAARLIFNTDRSEDGDILDLLTLALQLRTGIQDKLAIANTCNSMGMLYEKQKDFGKSEEQYKKSMSERIKAYDSVKPEKVKDRKLRAQDIAQSLTSLGNLKRSMFVTFDIEKVAQKRAAEARAQGKNKDEEAEVLEEAREAARKEKEVVFEAAKDYLEKAKGRYIEGFDADHPKVAWAVEGIASLYQAARRFREADEQWTESIKIRTALQDAADGKVLFNKELEKAREARLHIKQQRDQATPPSPT